MVNSISNIKKKLFNEGRFQQIRPFREDSKESLIKIVKSELSKEQVELPSLINTELGYHRNDPDARIEIGILFEKAKRKPIRWLYPARKELKKMSFNPKRSGDHSLYAVLLEYPNYPKYGVYIGESEYSFEERYQNHKKGEKYVSSRHVFKYGIEILYSLTGFFHPPAPIGPGPDKAYAKVLERKIGNRLKKDIFKKKSLPKNRVKGGH